MTTLTKDPLATLFCSMYSDTGRATHMLQRCGIGAEHLNPRQAASAFWTEAFTLVDRLGLLPRLVMFALADKSVAAFRGQLQAAWEEREKTEKRCAEPATDADTWTPARIAEALARCDRATAGPWRWWTSCSFRRLSSDPTGKDGDVAYGCIQHSDGHPDIAINDADMTFIAAARTDLPSALRALATAQGEIERLGDVVSKIVKQHLTLANDADRLKEENERLRADRAVSAAKIETMIGVTASAEDIRERAAVIAETCSGGDHTISNRDLIARRIRELPI
jgi:hypothetical protein